MLLITLVRLISKQKAIFYKTSSVSKCSQPLEFFYNSLFFSHAIANFISGASDVQLIFILAILFSKYSKLKLGKENEKPEFSDVTYFTMLFAGGIGIGLFYFGVAEPIFHYAPGIHGNRYWGR